MAITGTTLEAALDTLSATLAGLTPAKTATLPGGAVPVWHRSADPLPIETASVAKLDRAFWWRQDAAVEPEYSFDDTRLVRDDLTLLVGVRKYQSPDERIERENADARQLLGELRRASNRPSNVTVIDAELRQPPLELRSGETVLQIAVSITYWRAFP